MSFNPAHLRLALLVFAACTCAAQAQDARSTRLLASNCFQCHGTNGQARGDMKPLAGVSADKLLAMLADYRSGAQPATIMHQIVKGYTEEQIGKMWSGNLLRVMADVERVAREIQAGKR